MNQPRTISEILSKTRMLAAKMPKNPSKEELDRFFYEEFLKEFPEYKELFE